MQSCEDAALSACREACCAVACCTCCRLALSSHSLHDVTALIVPLVMVLAGLQLERETPEVWQLRVLRDAASQAEHAASRLMQERSKGCKSVKVLTRLQIAASMACRACQTCELIGDHWAQAH